MKNTRLNKIIADYMNNTGYTLYVESIDALVPVMDKLGCLSFSIQSRGSDNVFQAHMFRAKIHIGKETIREVRNGRCLALATAICEAIRQEANSTGESVVE